MTLHCCEKCQLFWSCETKWYRGERGEDNICCDRCDFYKQCLAEHKKGSNTKKKKSK